MKKKVLILFLCAFSVFTFKLDFVKADDSSVNGGQGKNVTVASGGTCNSVGVENCVWYNGMHITSRVTLYYFYENGSYVKLGTPVYITNNNTLESWGFTKANGWNMVQESLPGALIDYGNGTKVHDYSKFAVLFTGSSSSIKVKETVLNKYLGTGYINYSKSNLTKDSQKSSATTPATHGYRLVIEPVYSVADYESTGANGEIQLSIALRTAKEIAAMGNGFSNNSHFVASGTARVANASVNMYVKWKDVGISGLGNNPTPIGWTASERATIANFNSGYAMNIIDISEAVVQNQCYDIKVEGNVAKCQNTGKLNAGYVYETVTGPFTCPNNIPDDTVNQYGRLTYTGNSCKVYCLESATQEFPGSVKNKVQLGTHLQWPTNKQSQYNIYPLIIRGTKKCKVIGTNTNNCKTTTVINELLSDFNQSYKSDVNISWNNGIEIKETGTWADVTTNSLVSGDDITLLRTAYFSLPTNLNRYVNKETGEISDSPPNNASYIDIGYGNLSVSEDAELKDYDLTVINSSLGTSNVFKDLIDAQNYTCYYGVGAGDCLCPEDSLNNAGKSIYHLIKQDGITCAEGIQKYCYNEFRCDNPYTCGDDTANAGYLVECDGNCDQICNKTVLDAEDICEAPNIPDRDPGKIIYRTISLSDPFPSYDADKSILQTGLTIGMFNDNVKGRYPGSNWNSSLLVRNKILNNRGVDGDDVYNKKPLYTFVLTSEQIKAIRKYNNNNSYTDFNLDCLTNNSIACVSSFIRSNIAGLTGGTCSGKLTNNNFYTCAN